MQDTTQLQHPWRATVRTAVAALVALAAAAPIIYEAVFQTSPELATGALAGALAVAAAVTRLAALPAVQEFTERFIPWLAPAPPADLRIDHDNAEDDVLEAPEETGFVFDVEDTEEA